MHIETVLPGLLRQCRDEEDGVRSAVAECLGALISMHGPDLVPVLLNIAADEGDKLGR